MSLTKILLTEKRKRPEASPKKLTGEILYDYYASVVDKVKNDFTQEVYVHFTDIKKLGFNVKSPYKDTPVGMYAYPLTTLTRNEGYDPTKTSNQLIKEAFPFGTHRKWIYVFRVKPDAEILYLDETLTKEQANSYYAKAGMDQLSWSTPPSAQSVYIDIIKRTQIKKRGPEFLASNVFLKMGIDGVVDRKGEGVIHPSEKTQAVFFNPKVIEIIDIIPNKYKENAPYKAPESRINDQFIQKRKERAIEVIKSHPKNELRGKKFQPNPLGVSPNRWGSKRDYFQEVSISQFDSQPTIFINPTIINEFFPYACMSIGQDHAFLQGLVFLINWVGADQLTSDHLKSLFRALQGTYIGEIPNIVTPFEGVGAFESGYNIIFVYSPYESDEMAIKTIQNLFQKSKHKVGIYFKETGEIVDVS
jgi:hypothetical protein